MGRFAGRSVRLLFDLQACQTVGSAQRGVGRYSTALFEAIVAEREAPEVHALLGSGLPHEPEQLRLRADRVWRLPPLPDWSSPAGHEGGERDRLDALCYSALAQRLKPDIVHVSHVFEGLGDRVPLPELGQRAPGQVFSATLYDLIPLLFPEHYFAIPGLRPWYEARMAWLRGADLLLAISDSTREDAIRHLGVDPDKVVTIHGGIGAHFKPVADRDAALRSLRQVHPLRDRFVLYTGGDDFRKNLVGAIAGYARVPRALREDCQLVIVCSISEARRQELLALARARGLRDGEILFTGFVSEEDLVRLYGCCSAFVFPSLYEGLGLPVLEAMACGAPAIGGDNSSVREIIRRDDALFAPEDPQAIGQRIAAVLSDAGFARTLREYGQRRARDFQWTTSAQRALAAFDAALHRASEAGVGTFLAGWGPRRRLAMLTPLPPARSGIADYNREFLPHLARHFDIDVYADGPAQSPLPGVCRCFDVQGFEHVAGAYDAILYEFGNSAFHAHMLPLLERFPGIVGLHDAYLSGLYRHVAATSGRPRDYAAAMLDAHGPRARRYLAPAHLAPDADEQAMVDLPCSRAVLQRALGVISHSPFNLAVARASYPEGWPGPYRIVPQMVARRERVTAAARAAARERLGFGSADFVVVSMGHVAWTKWGDRLLGAFLASTLRDEPRAHLVFAGELSQDAFGAELGAAVARSGLGRRARITGYLSDADYEAYLAAADLAVQLRTRSRGGTPKGVLDCLARGVPVALNNDASFVDYPDDVVVKVDPDPEPRAIARVLDRAFADRAWLDGVACAGRDYAGRHHDPARCAAAYAAAIHEMMERERLARLGPWPAAFGPALANCREPAAATAHAAAFLDALPSHCFRRPRLVVDVSHIAQTDHQTGVPRVVSKVVRSIYATRRADLDPVAVELRDGGLFEARDWLATQGLLTPAEQESPPAEVEFRPGDTLLMLDSSWARYREFHPVFARARAVGVPVVTAIYDLLPMLLPEGNIVEGGKEWFRSWFRDAVAQSDALVCISRAVADDVIGQLRDPDGPGKRLRVGHWHLGADFAERAGPDPPSERVRAAARQPYLLMVGTIEPRKCHALALDAMECLWKRDEPTGLVVAGKEGWMVQALMQRLRDHPQLGSRLHLIEAPTDAELADLYDGARGLLFLSRGEGFGLPLVEAAHHGTPILCSDLPVFREIAGDHAAYVTGDAAGELSGEIADWLARRKAGSVPDSKAIPRLTWEQSAEALLSVVIDGRWQACVGPDGRVVAGDA